MQNFSSLTLQLKTIMVKLDFSSLNIAVTKWNKKSCFHFWVFVNPSLRFWNKLCGINKFWYKSSFIYWKHVSGYHRGNEKKPFSSLGSLWHFPSKPKSCQTNINYTYTAKIYDAITSLLLHKCCTLNLTTTCLHLIVVHYYLSYSTTTTLQRTVVFSTTFLIYFVVAANCRYNYDDL